MKKIFILLIIISFSVTAFSQKLIKDEIDKFTKNKVKETSFEVLAMPFKNALRFSIRSINGSMYIRFKVSLHDAFRIDEGDYVYLALENGETIRLECTKGEVADYIDGLGSLWVAHGNYDISQSDIDKINASKIVAARVDTGEYKVEFEKIKEKNDIKFKKAISLVQE